MQTSCYYCHSNNTQYPRYFYIQPARLFMESHIPQGKKDLNFSEWEIIRNENKEIN
ncbi:heme-binding domain-containing protein [Flavobacterium sp.]|uniref:heme-binding domain-containing protein n=1 Tax=unclassified Flavobacterium TaxID=196869 RepID=UPI0025BD48D4|nr:heme-binding domain-containing protein [Flavobacterium sp.]